MEIDRIDVWQFELTISKKFQNENFCSIISLIRNYFLTYSIRNRINKNDALYKIQYRIRIKVKYLFKYLFYYIEISYDININRKKKD